MFDFLLTEEFWMETIIAALISGFVGIVIALVGLLPQMIALKRQLETHDKDSVGRKDKLSVEHAALSKENSALSKDLSSIGSAVTFLKEGRIQDEARRDSMRGKELETQKALEVLNASLSYMADLEQKMSKAQEENAALQAEIKALRMENAALRQELDRRAEQEGEEEQEL